MFYSNVITQFGFFIISMVTTNNVYFLSKVSL